MAQAEIIVADEALLPEAVELYNSIFRPARDLAYFEKRFTHRHNALSLIARVDERPVGFWFGFDLKPNVFYHWMGGVTPEFRRQGIASQLHAGQASWAVENGYDYLRTECLNPQKEFIHFALQAGYNIAGVRYDSTHLDNLIVFEKSLEE